MPRINIEPDWFFDPRRSALLARVGREVETVAIEMWLLGQKYYRDKSLVPVRIYEMMPRWKEFEESGLAKREVGGVYICGSSKFFEWLEKKKAAGHSGGVASASIRRAKASKRKHLLDGGIFGEPSSSSSSSSSSSDSDKEKYISLLAEFEQQFWLAYPRKVGRKDALRAFLKARASAQLETILAALKLQNETEFRGRDPQYIPHAATWLNGEGWNDETPKTWQEKFIEETSIENLIPESEIHHDQ